MPLVGIVNQALAMRLASKSNPIGELLRTGFGPKPIEIVGVAKDAKYDNVLADTVPTIYVPLAQFDLTPSFRVFEVRTSADSTATISTLQRTIQSLEPNLPAEIRPLGDSIGETLLTERLTARITGLFGVVGLQLACIGLYGLMSYIVTQKTAELGIRMAMGADRVDVFRLVMKEASMLLFVGLAIGLTLSVAGTHLIGSELFGTAATDPASFVAATTLMLFAGALASYMPALRATRIDPIVALRYE